MKAPLRCLIHSNKSSPLSRFRNSFCEAAEGGFHFSFSPFELLFKVMVPESLCIKYEY